MPINRRDFVAASAAFGGLGLAGCAQSQSAPQFRPGANALYDDAQYGQPFIDVDEWRDEPVRHRYVHGGFEGTDLLFSFYFPPEEQYQGRFFQFLAAISGAENAAPMALFSASGIGFALESGGYLVESNQGAKNMFGGSYQANAAAAEYSRVLAAQMYGDHRPYGYIYGGSGGAFKTLACVENTSVWDGAIPFVHGTPVSIPSFFTAQAHAMRILGPKFPQIVDALDPGGSGDIYAGLNTEERDALREVTGMGFPPRAWFNYEKIAFGYTGVFTSLVDGVVASDPTYFEEFWEKPGYLGANPTRSLSEARIQAPTRIKSLVMPDEARALGIPLTMSAGQSASGVQFPAALRMENLPEGSLQGATILVRSGKAKDAMLHIAGAMGDLVMIGFGASSFRALAALRAGDEVTIDNSIYLASQTYHRHIDPGEEYYVWDQFKYEHGDYIYPQRESKMGNISPGMSPTSGARQDGSFNCTKLMVMQALMDEAAYPWGADWFRKRVEAQHGPDYNDKYRLYFIDNTMHTTQTSKPTDPRPVATTRVISYQGALQRMLRDLTKWVEQGVEPPPSTEYAVENGQVVVPETAKARRGVQPVVELTANGAARADVMVGEAVRFVGAVSAPDGAGVIIDAEWDFEGSGEYPVKSDIHSPAQSVEIGETYTFSEPGTYFPALRVSSVDELTRASVYARPQNIGRVRVVVT